MAVIYGTREAASIGPRTTLTFTYPAPQEQSPGSLPIPDSEPGTPQFSFTIGSGDIPVLSGIGLSDVLIAPLLYIAGEDLDSAAHTIHAAVYLNSVQILGRSRTTDAKALWMWGLFPGGNIAVNDVLEIAVWADDLATLTVNFGGMGLVASQPRAVAGNALLLDVRYDTLVPVPLFVTSGIINVTSQNGEVKTLGFPGGAPVPPKPALVVDDSEPIFVAYYDGTFDNDQFLSDDGFRSYYNCNQPTTISFYTTSIRFS